MRRPGFLRDAHAAFPKARAGVQEEHWGGAGCGELRLVDSPVPAPADWSRSDTGGVGGGASPGSTHRWLGSAIGLQLRSLDAGIVGSRPLRSAFVLAPSVAPADPSVPAAEPVKKDAGWW